MRPLVGSFVVVLLAVLLAGTTPIGTGSGAHQSMLLHPLIPHVHIVNGRIVSHEQLEASAESEPTVDHVRPGKPGISAGSGADSAESGLALSPTLPLQAVDLSAGPTEPNVVGDARLPRGRTEAPPDPPPTAAA